MVTTRVLLVLAVVVVVVVLALDDDVVVGVCGLQQQERLQRSGGRGQVVDPFVACFIPSGPDPTDYAFEAMRTWGRKCDVIHFTSNKADASIDMVKAHDLPMCSKENWKIRSASIDMNGASRCRLFDQIASGWVFMYENYGSIAHYIIKVDGDTYLNIPRLKHFLTKYYAPHDNKKHLYLGMPSYAHFYDGWYNIGAAYILSTAALRDFLVPAIRSGACTIGEKTQEPPLACSDGTHCDRDEPMQARCLELAFSRAHDEINVHGTNFPHPESPGFAAGDGHGNLLLQFKQTLPNFDSGDDMEKLARGEPYCVDASVETALVGLGGCATQSAWLKNFVEVGQLGCATSEQQLCADRCVLALHPIKNVTRMRMLHTAMEMSATTAPVASCWSSHIPYDRGDDLRKVF
ncbi:glycoprotein-N-acetylgalactosamine 3-beta-galactosyltransferase [Pycnococcus provasolii]|uniref:N-acetylgalactosaminide beta-1,3-galactosyltransferase n=1 Tax=Pycnococcus provasolii TaxID=41880 RepID=A0A830HXD2_9CHLO|nr:glycoprotein-N-acetylgalactosamine 3-beta-galactosyltransferase [Pycnococcus provasolii]